MIAIIPARGGSKGLPGKNIKVFAGLPLIAHTIKAALSSKIISKVIVSTDCKDIAQIAKEYGAEVPFLRPDYLATDDASAVDNYIYSIEKLEEILGEEIPSFVVLQPTSPLRMVEDIDGAINLFVNKDADSVISYTKESHPITWHKYLTPSGNFENIFDENLDNRQEYRESYYPNGAIYVFKKELIFKKKYYSEHSYAYVMPRERSVDIDFQIDFNYAEFLKRHYGGK